VRRGYATHLMLRTILHKHCCDTVVICLSLGTCIKRHGESHIQRCIDHAVMLASERGFDCVGYYVLVHLLLVIIRLAFEPFAVT